MLYLITVLHSGNARRRNVRFRKSHFSTGEILALEREEAESNGRSSKTGVDGVLMATERRKTAAEFNIIEVDYIYYLCTQVEEYLDKQHKFVICLNQEVKSQTISKLLIWIETCSLSATVCAAAEYASESLTLQIWFIEMYETHNKLLWTYQLWWKTKNEGGREQKVEENKSVWKKKLPLVQQNMTSDDDITCCLLFRHLRHMADT